MIHNNQALLYVSYIETSATALCGSTGILSTTYAHWNHLHLRSHDLVARLAACLPYALSKVTTCVEFTQLFLLWFPVSWSWLWGKDNKDITWSLGVFQHSGRRVAIIFWQFALAAFSCISIISAYHHIPRKYFTYKHIYIYTSITSPSYLFWFRLSPTGSPPGWCLRSLAVGRFIFCYILGLHKECWPGWSWDPAPHI